MNHWLPNLQQNLSQNVLQQRDLSQNSADAAVMLLLTKEAEPKVLLTRRSDALKSHSGEVSLPGGKRDATDQDIIHTAIRETTEEVGIPAAAILPIGLLPQQISKSGLNVQPVVGLIDAHTPLTLSPDEIDHAFWVPLHTIFTQPPKPYSINYQGMNISMPSWQVLTDKGPEIVWGLTGRILVSLADIGFDHQIEWPFMYPPKLSTNDHTGA